MNLPVHPEFCASLSVANEEPIVGTAAASTSVWLAFEVAGTWPHDAMQADAVPDVLRARLREWALAVPGFRPQAIRRPARDEAQTPAVFVALTGPEVCTTVELSLPSLAALAELDLPSVVQRVRDDDPGPDVRVVSGPMLWVCVHGKRDRCCAKWGAPVYEALAARPDLEVWQTSHLGGHRFAATLLCLPHGVCYGRLGPEHASALASASATAEVFSLAHLRGRTCWSAAGQAALHFVREATSERAVEGLSVESEQALDEGVRVGVRTPQGRFDVQVQRRKLGAMARPSCTKDPAPVMGWQLVTLERSA